jgi:SAM-dependent methyltransferase
MQCDIDYTDVTELSGDEVTREQVERICQRYFWAGGYCQDRDVVELACGTGQGLGYISSMARSLIAGDISAPMVEKARAHYTDRIDIRVMDAHETRLPALSCDVVILFEALYYLHDVEGFIMECRRILRDGGYLLIATANKDLYDFNPSPHSVAYHGVKELGCLLGHHGFSCDFFGGTPVGATSYRQRALRPLKRLAVRLNLLPRTMAAKKILKRLIFGRLISMPAEIAAGQCDVEPPAELAPGIADRIYKVIYCAAQKR